MNEKTTVIPSTAQNTRFRNDQSPPRQSKDWKYMLGWMRRSMKRVASTHCLFQGPLVGTLRCSCSGAATIYTCFNSTDNPNSLCSDYAKDDAPEGVIHKDGKPSAEK